MGITLVKCLSTTRSPAKSQFTKGMEIDQTQLSEYSNRALTWIGFGTVVGLKAKSLIQGRDPGGSDHNGFDGHRWNANWLRYSVLFFYCG